MTVNDTFPFGQIFVQSQLKELNENVDLDFSRLVSTGWDGCRPILLDFQMPKLQQMFPARSVSSGATCDGPRRSPDSSVSGLFRVGLLPEGK